MCHSAPLVQGNLFGRLTVDEKQAHAAVDSTIYIDNTNQMMFAIDAQDGSERWRFATEDWVTADPVMVGDAICSTRSSRGAQAEHTAVVRPA